MTKTGLKLHVILWSEVIHLACKYFYLHCNLELVKRANIFHQDCYSELVRCFLDKKKALGRTCIASPVNDNPVKMGIKIP